MFWVLPRVLAKAEAVCEIWTQPNPKLISDTIFFWYRMQYFFDTKCFQYRYLSRYQKISKLIPILFTIPNYSKPIPILFTVPKIFETDIDTIKKYGKLLKPRSFETEMSHSGQRGTIRSGCTEQSEVRFDLGVAMRQWLLLPLVSTSDMLTCSPV